jgi:hypothetical protein
MGKRIPFGGTRADVAARRPRPNPAIGRGAGGLARSLEERDLSRAREGVSMRRTWAVIGLTVLLAGCAGRAETIPANYRLGESDTSVVIGRIEAVRAPDSKSDDLNKILKGHMVLGLMQEGSEVPYSIKTADEDFGSDFYVALPPARYRIVEWRNRALQAPMRGWFDVPPGSVVYIGTLRWNDRGRDLLFRHGHWTLHDETEAVSARFRARFPAIDARITKSLITAQPPRGVSASP